MNQNRWYLITPILPKNNNECKLFVQVLFRNVSVPTNRKSNYKYSFDENSFVFKSSLILFVLS